jgi:hypothetical protein
MDKIMENFRASPWLGVDGRNAHVRIVMQRQTNHNSGSRVPCVGGVPRAGLACDHESVVFAGLKICLVQQIVTITIRGHLSN